MMPYKIMPDPDDPEQFLLGRNDSELNTIIAHAARREKAVRRKKQAGVWGDLGNIAMRALRT